MERELVYLAGGEIHEVHPLPPYSDVVCNFLEEFSYELLHDNDCKAYPDIVSVAFWARKGSMGKLRESIGKEEIRIGRGVAFHVTPSNIPVQFIFSYMFGLLAGNANIVRVTSKDYPQIVLLCKVLQRILDREEFLELRAMTGIVRYPRESEWTERFSSQCQVRLIWGGDATIDSIRKCHLPPGATELVFPDRYSLALLHAGVLAEANEEEVQRLARDFYNDTFLMDQNACSSPQLILWKDGQGNMDGKERFWKAVGNLARKHYDFPAIKATSKYARFCTNAVRFTVPSELHFLDNYLYRVTLEHLPEHVESLRGSFGLFYEYDIKDFSCISSLVNEKYQTLTYFGFHPSELAQLVVRNRWLGIDRIVPVGKALDMGILWDGYDLVREMSRVIDAR